MTNEREPQTKTTMNMSISTTTRSATTRPATVTRLRPQSYTETIELGGGVIYFAPDYSAAIAYEGKRQKSTWHYRFRSEREAKETFEQFTERVRERSQRKERRRAEQASLDIRGTINEGAILVSRWGWEQTNVDAYQVIRVCGKRTVEVRKIEVATVPGSRAPLSMCDRVVPVPDAFIGEATKRITFVPGLKDLIPKFTYDYGDVWDGERSYGRSWYG